MYSLSLDPATLGIVSFIVVVVGGLIVGAIAIITDYQRKRAIVEMHHRERMAAIERGLPPPPLPDTEPYRERDHGRELDALKEIGPYIRMHYRRRQNRLGRGLTWIILGAALFVAIAVNRDYETAVWALIPIAMGVANLLTYALTRGERDELPRDPARPGPTP